MGVMSYFFLYDYHEAEGDFQTGIEGTLVYWLF